VHTHGSKPGVLGRLAAWRAKVPVIVHTYHGHVFHSYFSRPVSAAIVLLERWLAKRTSLLLAINQKLKSELEDTYHIAPAGKIVLNRLGVEWEKLQDLDGSQRSAFRSAWQLADEEIAVAIVGRLVPVKQQGLFIQMAEHLLQQAAACRFRFFIVGDGEEKSRLMHQVLQNGRSCRTTQAEAPADFTFTSWQTQMSGLLAGMDIVVLTSLNEGTPVSILEAMAAAKPVVSTPVGGIPELFREARFGCTGELPADLAAPILELAQNSRYRAEQGKAGAAYIKTHLSIASQAASLAAVFRQQLAAS
jgi:glycosyltransferase involved in cell wall biosynthesis